MWRCFSLIWFLTAAARASDDAAAVLPRALDSYGDPAGAGLRDVLVRRAAAEPLNAAALAIFLCAIIHTFLTAKIRRWAHALEEGHGNRAAAKTLHLLGEVELVFGAWAVVLAAAIVWFKGWSAAGDYIGRRVSYTEPLFVVVVMALASTRSVLGFAERCLRAVARLGHGTPGAWWVAILVVAPLLGSLITEPAAMTIAALLLGRQFYDLQPGLRLRYATLGLLFVNVSIGGTLTPFAAPPVIMVARAWNWGFVHMLAHFGWRAALGIAMSTLLYFLAFRRELASLVPSAGARELKSADAPGPAWITGVQLAFMAFAVWQAHHPAVFIGAFLVFLAFRRATRSLQGPLDLRPPILVGCFLAGLVIHGGLQAWWIEPVLVRLGRLPLFFGATVLTAFNDNAAITYLASLVPGFTEPLKYAVVAGAVTGGGLTVIANAPNPAGQSILGRHFPDGIAPLSLAAGALPATIVVGLCFIAL